MSNRRARALVVLGITSIAAASQAVLLPPGGTVIPAPSGPVPGGTVIGSLVSPFAVPGVFSGTVSTAVYAGDPTNGLGGLTFLYRIINDPGSSHSIGRTTLNGFGLFQTDVSWMPGSMRAPALIDRPLPGDRLGFSFFNFGGPPTGLILPGEVSYVVVRTDAPSFTFNTGAVIDGDVATVDILSPVPEPATMAVVGLGFAALARRRRK